MTAVELVRKSQFGGIEPIGPVDGLHVVCERKKKKKEIKDNS